MKVKILLTIVMYLFVTHTSYGQINPGQILLGGSISYNNNNSNTQASNNYKNENFATSIQVGKSIKNNRVEGIIISYSNSNSHILGFPDSNFSRVNQINAGVFYRMYKRIFKDFYFFGEADLLYSHIKNDQGYPQNGSNSSTTNSNGGILTFFPGVSYALCKRMQVELLVPNLLSASYYRTSSVNTQETPSSVTHEKGYNFSIGANLNSNLLYSFGIGFKFLLGK
ncbi:MAG TPA: hypothetical protein VIJ92_09615 [Ginsengibacter sp.]